MLTILRKKSSHKLILPARGSIHCTNKILKETNNRTLVEKQMTHMYTRLKVLVAKVFSYKSEKFSIQQNHIIKSLLVSFGLSIRAIVSRTDLELG